MTIYFYPFIHRINRIHKLLTIVTCIRASVSVYPVNRMENLDPELPELVILIVGRSLLPYCHFDIPESDYLFGDRRDTKLPGPIGYQSNDNSVPENTRVIELDVIGIGGSHVK